MDDFDTDFKNPIGIFNLEMDQNWTYIWSTKWIIDLLSSLNNQITTANPAPFPAGNWGPGADHRLGVGLIVFFKGLLKNLKKMTKKWIKSIRVFGENPTTGF